jgi:hypothetical protein
MAKTEKTAAERQAWAAKMRAAKLAKQAQTTNAPAEPAEPMNSAPVDHGTVSAQDYADMKRQIDELKGYLFDLTRNQGQNNSNNGAQVTSSGVVGTIEKYVLDPSVYPNPCERLSKESKLSRFAFDLNFELEFLVKVTQYDTKDGLHVKEPRFELQLNRIVMDEETGEPTDGRYIVTKGLFHEDPQAALVIAQEQGLNVSDFEEKAFLDEMRYLRFRDWLLEAFYTPLIDKKKTNVREVVVGGRLVQYFEVNNEEGGTGMTKQNWDAAPRIKF